MDKNAIWKQFVKVAAYRFSQR